MKRTKDDLIAGIKRQNEYVLRHNKQLREENENLRAAVEQLNSMVHAILFSAAQKCGEKRDDGSMTLTIARPNLAESKLYKQETKIENDEMRIAFLRKNEEKT